MFAQLPGVKPTDVPDWRLLREHTHTHHIFTWFSVDTYMYVRPLFLTYIMCTCMYTGWPRKNATTLIVNFKDIMNKTELIFVLSCGKFTFQQNNTMIINFG